MLVPFKSGPGDTGADARGCHLPEFFDSSQGKNLGRSVVCKVDLNHEVGSSGEELRIRLLSLHCERFVEVVGSNEFHAPNLADATVGDAVGNR